ncbi:MAG: GNAT family N-acetyltransferase [Candidatus Nanopelagicales bacterium]
MRVIRPGDPAAFLELTAAYRAADPVRTNVIGSVATGVLQGRAYDAEHWWVVQDDGGSVVGAAIWTEPYRLLLAPMPAEAAVALAADVVGMPAVPPGVIGPEETVDVVVAATGWTTEVHMREHVLVLEEFAPSTGVPGHARTLTDDDVDLATEWMRQFSIDAGALIADPREAVVGRMANHRFWVVDGEPVALASHAPLVGSESGTVGRVGPVFTPAEHRRRGYGGAVTSAVVEHLLPLTTTVMLFTDAANPTSNGVYERLGFRQVADVVDLTIT